MATGLVGRAYKEIFEDWTCGDRIHTADANGVVWLVSSDSGGTAFAITADAEGPLARGTTDTTDDDMCEIAHHLISWSVQNGELLLQTRIRADVVSTLAFTVGFNDDDLEASNTLPVELATTTFTSNAASFAGVVYDVDADNDDLHAFWVDDDNDTSEAIADLRFSGFAPVADEWFGVQVVLTDRGSGNAAAAEFTIVEESTGKHAQKDFVTTLDRDVLLTPHIAFENHGAAAHNFDIDYIWVRQSRSTT